MLDVAAVPLAIGYALGRVGCQLAGDGDYGVPWDGPWAMAYPNGTVPTTEEVHPTPVYETLAMGLVAVLLWRWRHRWRAGTLFGLYLILAGAERFLVEFVRRNDDVFLGLTSPQLLSIAMMAGGALWIVLVNRRAERTAPVAARA
jgi:phosphatidylglycerol:prolipoprotein diacylglycerol transferase